MALNQEPQWNMYTQTHKGNGATGFFYVSMLALSVSESVSNNTQCTFHKMPHSENTKLNQTAKATIWRSSQSAVLLEVQKPQDEKQWRVAFSEFTVKHKESRDKKTNSSLAEHELLFFLKQQECFAQPMNSSFFMYCQHFVLRKVIGRFIFQSICILVVPSKSANQKHAKSIFKDLTLSQTWRLETFN